MVATPPFNISVTTPADVDIVSQFPANERTNRDNINQWLQTDHDINGQHVKLTMPYQGSAPTTPGASLLKMYADVNGNLVYVAPDGLIRYVGVPPGTVTFTAASTPDVGYVFANGQAISRTGIGTALFARLSTIFGTGNGSTTFNVPDINGRVIASADNGAGRLNSAGGMTTGNWTDVGGSQIQTLTLAQLPQNITSNLNVNVTLNGATSVNVAQGINPVTTPGGGFAFNGVTSQAVAAVSVSGNINTNNVVSINTSGNFHPNVQATIVLNAQIKL